MLLPCHGYCEQYCSEHRGAFIFLKYSLVQIYTRNGITGSCGNSIFIFLRKLHTVFHSVYPNLYYPQQEGSLFSTPSPAFAIVDFLMMTILTGVRQYRITLCVIIIWEYILPKWLAKEVEVSVYFMYFLRARQRIDPEK